MSGLVITRFALRRAHARSGPGVSPSYTAALIAGKANPRIARSWSFASALVGKRNSAVARGSAVRRSIVASWYTRLLPLAVPVADRDVPSGAHRVEPGRLMLPQRRDTHPLQADSEFGCERSCGRGLGDARLEPFEVHERVGVLRRRTQPFEQFGGVHTAIVSARNDADSLW